MRLIPRTILSCAISGNNLAAALVTVGPGGATARAGLLLRDFLSLPSEEVRREFSRLGFKPGTTCLLTIPTSWCALRPVPVSAGQWSGAKIELLASVERLLPMTPEDAVLGYISAAANEGDAEAAARGGWIIGARRSRIAPWTEHLARAGVSRISVLAAPMAALGLGLQRRERAELIDELGGDLRVRHELRLGELVDLGSPAMEGDQPVSEFGVDLARIAPEELAIAAVIACEVSGGAGAFFALDGRTPSAPKRWFIPAAAALLAAGAVWGSIYTTGARYQSAIDSLKDDRAMTEAEFKKADAARADATRLAALIDQGFNRRVKKWGSILPALGGAMAALPSEGFLYRLELDDQSVTMRGEAKHAAEVLRKLEDTPGFKSAKSTDPESPVVERGLETFTVRAERVAPAPAPKPQAEKGAGS